MKYKLKSSAHCLVLRTRTAWGMLRFKAWVLLRKTEGLLRKKGAADVSKSVIDYLLRSMDGETLTQEIKTACQRFGYMLEPSFQYLQGMPHAFFSTEEALHHGWLYALDGDASAGLLHLYQELLKLEGREKGSLAHWMAYLQAQGLRRVDDGVEQLTVSPVIRRWYENCLGMEDGEICTIESHPWALEDALAVSGMLRR